MDYFAIQVTDVRPLTPRMTRISFTGDDLRGFADTGPDSYIKIFFPLPGQERPQLPPPLTGDEIMSWYRTYLAMPDEIRAPLRTYTIRAHRPDRAEIDVDFVVHGDNGPATRWAQAARPGDQVAFLGPVGLYAVPEHADWQLLVGDESALPAIGAIIERLPRGTVARAYVEIDGPAEEQSFDTRGQVEIHWVHRNSGAHGEALLDAVRAAKFPGGTPYAWVSGEASLVKFTRRHLVSDRGVDKRAITFTGYWRLGVDADEESRESLRQAEAVGS